MSAHCSFVSIWWNTDDAASKAMLPWMSPTGGIEVASTTSDSTLGGNEVGCVAIRVDFTIAPLGSSRDDSRGTC